MCAKGIDFASFYDFAIGYSDSIVFLLFEVAWTVFHNSNLSWQFCKMFANDKKKFDKNTYHSLQIIWIHALFLIVCLFLRSNNNLPQ